MAAPTRLKFFPTLTLPAPTSNGNGKSLALVPEQKSIRFQYAAADFHPVGTDAIAFGNPDGLGWYAASWLVYACMSFRATKLAQAPLWITEEQDGEEEWIDEDHELAEILKRPNPDMRMRAFLERTSLYLDGTGRCCWVKVRDRGGRVAALRPFSDEDVLKILPEGEKAHGRFKIRTAAMPSGQWFDAADVIHLYNEDPSDPYGCLSPLAAAAARLGIDQTLVESIRAGLRNAVVPGMILTFPDHLSEEQVGEYRASIAATYQDAKSHGKSFIAGGGLTANQATLGFAGLQAGELGKEIEAAICACFQIPPVVIGAYVGLANSSDRHNLETSRALFYENAIEPLWVRIEEALTDDLLAEVDANPLRFVRFVKDDIKALQEDQGAKADIIQKAGKALTVNDARVMLGLAPLDPKDPRGEELMGAVAAKPPQPGEEPEDEEEDEQEPKRRRSSIQRKGISDDEVHWIVFDQVARAQEMGWEMAAAQQLEADRAAVLDLAARYLRTAQKDDDPFAPADVGTVRELIRAVAEHMDLEAAVQWRQKVVPLIQATARRAVERISAQVGIAFDLLQPGLLPYVEKHAATLVTQVTDTTKQSIRDALGAGLADGDGIPALTKRIEESAAFSRDRAELIARTETTRVTNGSQRESLAAHAAATGDRITKRWLNAGDERVRDQHREPLNGEVRGVDEAFSNGLQAPGEPNCRCTLVFAMEG